MNFRAVKNQIPPMPSSKPDQDMRQFVACSSPDQIINNAFDNPLQLNPETRSAKTRSFAMNLVRNAICP